MDLPTELYRPIIGYVRDWSTLLSLMVSSRRLSAEAERSLYYKFEHVYNGRSQVLFLQRVVDCPRVAQIVYSYKFEVDWRTNFGRDHVFWEILPKAFRALVNLKALQFRTNGSISVEGLLDGCTFQLEHLHWYCPSYETQMQSFLPTQRKLKSLSLGEWDDTQFSAPHNYDEQPDLREVAGAYGVVHAFLPGREITHVRWVPGQDDPWDTTTGLDIEGLACSLQKVRFLKFGGFFTRPHICIISEYLSSMVFLELMGYEEIEDLSISSLPSLKLLRISRRWGLSRMSEVHTEELFAGSKSLQAIEIEEKDSPKHEDNGNKYYSRWERHVGMVNSGFQLLGMWPDVC